MSERKRITLCPLDELEVDEMKQVKVEGFKTLCVYHTADGVFVTEDTCTHGLASLSEGFLEDGVVYCPFHGGAFNVASGEAVELPCTDPIQTFEAKIEQGKVVIEI
jgi:nitrite reductase/ring-hydroxylating ferredoxin subunit